MATNKSGELVLTIQQLKQKITAERILTFTIFALILTFFLVEMLMKPISGEDIFQQQCMNRLGWSGIGECTSSTMSTIPRIGQVFHHAIIWQFHNLPTFGLETLIRTLDALMCFGIIYLITTLALQGRRPRLQAKDAIIAASAFIILIISPFTEMFFKGFSNVHNYVPAVFFTLLLGFLCFHRTKILRHINVAVFNILLFITSFLFAASTEFNAIILLLITIPCIVFRLWRRRPIIPNIKPHIPAVFGIILGIIFIFIIGNGFGSAMDRSAGGYMGSINLQNLFTTPLRTGAALIANLIRHLTSYLPYLLLGTAGIILTRHRASKTAATHHSLLSTYLIFSILYVCLCAPVTYVMQRLSVVAFGALLVPIASLIAILIDKLNSSRIRIVTLASLGLIIVAMIADNFIFLYRDLAATGTALSQINSAQCLDPRAIAKARLPTHSKFFRFSHPENALIYTTSSWYLDFYPINGAKIPIKPSCL